MGAGGVILLTFRFLFHARLDNGQLCRREDHNSLRWLAEFALVRLLMAPHVLPLGQLSSDHRDKNLKVQFNANVALINFVPHCDLVHINKQLDALYAVLMVALKAKRW